MSWRGHEITRSNGSWSYLDGTPVRDDPYRACGHCGQANTRKGHDACIADLPGVLNACCGHGIEGDAYCQLVSGVTLRGREAREYQENGGGREGMSKVLHTDPDAPELKDLFRSVADAMSLAEKNGAAAERRRILEALRAEANRRLSSPFGAPDWGPHGLGAAADFIESLPAPGTDSPEGQD